MESEGTADNLHESFEAAMKAYRDLVDDKVIDCRFCVPLRNACTGMATSPTSGGVALKGLRCSHELQSEATT